MFKISPKKKFEKFLNKSLEKITKHGVEYKLDILMQNDYDFESNICVKVNKKFREIFELQSESTIESVFHELETVLIDEDWVEEIRFISNSTYFKMSDSFWDSVKQEKENSEEVTVLDLVHPENEIDEEIKKIIFQFVKEGENVNVVDFREEFEVVKNLEKRSLENLFHFLVKEEIDSDCKELSLLQKKGRILDKIIQTKFGKDVIFFY